MRYLICAALLAIAACDAAPTNGVAAQGAGEQVRDMSYVSAANQSRAAAGLPPLRENARLNKAARAHAADMNANDFMSHIGSNGSAFTDRASAAGYSCIKYENVAQGQRTTQAVHTALMNSPGHRRNILARDARDIGVGRVGTSWVMMFGRGC